MPFWKLLYHNYVQSSFSAITRHIDSILKNNHPKVEDLRTWIKIRSNSFIKTWINIMKQKSQRRLENHHFQKKNTILHFKDHCTKINISLIVIWFFCSQTFKQTYNPGQNIWSKLEKSSKIGQKKESLITTFACFLTAIAKV